MSFLGLLWSASLMFDAINEAVNSAWGVRHPERYVISKLKSFLMMTILLFFRHELNGTDDAGRTGRPFDLFLRVPSEMSIGPWDIGFGLS